MIMRLIAWIVCYWLASGALALVVGLIAGFVAPLLVLTGRSVSKPDIATPEKVVAREVIRHQPVGFTKHCGWDEAWPEYNPYQAVRDAIAVYREITLVRGWVWEKVRLRPHREVVRSDAYGNLMPVEPTVGAFSKLTWGVFVPVPFAGFIGGMYGSYASWLFIMGVVGGAVYACQQAWTLAYRWWDRAVMARVRAQVKCPHCYETNPRPSYCCPNQACTITSPQGRWGLFGVGAGAGQPCRRRSGPPRKSLSRCARAAGNPWSRAVVRVGLFSCPPSALSVQVRRVFSQQR